MRLQRTSSNSQRKHYIDFLRIVAILMVIYNHTGIYGFSLFVIARENPLYWIYLSSSIFIKVAVPVFFMISGAMLIPKEETIADTLKKRVLKYSGILFGASILSYFYSLDWDFSAVSVRSFISTFYSKQWATTYWYLYSYIAFLLVLPVIRKMVRAMSNKDFCYLILMYFIFSSLPVLDWILWKGEISVNRNFAAFITTNNLFYPLIGYFIDSRLPQKYMSRKHLAILCLISAAVIAFCAVLNHNRCVVTNSWEETNSQPFFNTYIFIPSIALFLCAKALFEKVRIHSVVLSLMQTLGSCSFGVMLIEHICRDSTCRVYNIFRPYIRTLPSTAIWVLCAWLMGVAITLIVKQIPVLKKYI